MSGYEHPTVFLVVGYDEETGESTYRWRCKCGARAVQACDDQERSYLHGQEHIWDDHG